MDFYGLCCGKISIEDVKKLGLIKKLKKEQIKIPPFMRDMDQYMTALDIIAKVNHIDDYVEEMRLKDGGMLPVFQISSTIIVPDEMEDDVVVEDDFDDNVE